MLHIYLSNKKMQYVKIFCWKIQTNRFNTNNNALPLFTSIGRKTASLFTVPTSQSFRNFWLNRSLLLKSKCAGYLISLWNYFQIHYIDVRWCTSKWTLDHRQNKRGITLRLPFHYLILFIPSVARKLHFLDNIRHILLVK